MIARTRELTLKQFDVMQTEIDVRLTADSNARQKGDCYAAVKIPASPENIRALADMGGKRFRVTIEEID